MGLGSKFPCASTDSCFSSVAPKLVSTKSGGRAPAMAHRQDLAILNSSESYFCTNKRPKQELETSFHFHLAKNKQLTRRKEDKTWNKVTEEKNNREMLNHRMVHFTSLLLTNNNLRLQRYDWETEWKHQEKNFYCLQLLLCLLPHRKTQKIKKITERDNKILSIL